MAIALKYAMFNTPRELATFVADAGNNVAAITAIEFDGASGKWVVFYTEGA